MNSPQNFAVFLYDINMGMQVYMGSAHELEAALSYTERYDQSGYFAIYRYCGNTWEFNSTQRANVYRLIQKIKGKTNNNLYPFTPYEYAIKFDNAHDWYFKTHG